MRFFVKCAYCGKIVRPSLAIRLKDEGETDEEFACLKCLVYMNNQSIFNLNNILNKLLETLKSQTEEKIEELEERSLVDNEKSTEDN